MYFVTLSLAKSLLPWLDHQSIVIYELRIVICLFFVTFLLQLVYIIDFIFHSDIMMVKTE